MPLRPGLEKALSAAYNQNVSAGLVNPETAENLGDLATAVVSAFDASADDQKRQRLLNGLEQVTNPDIKKVFETIFTATERFFGRAGITMPTTQEFVDAGINFEDIATVYAQEKDAGHEPQMVVAANGLSLETWRQLCRDIGKASAKESASSERPKLLIYAKYGIITNWSILTDLSHLPGAGANSRVMTHQGIPWTIRIIPGTPAPTVTEVDHA